MSSIARGSYSLVQAKGPACFSASQRRKGTREATNRHLDIVKIVQPGFNQ